MSVGRFPAIPNAGLRIVRADGMAIVLYTIAVRAVGRVGANSRIPFPEHTEHGGYARELERGCYTCQTMCDTTRFAAPRFLARITQVPTLLRRLQCVVGPVEPKMRAVIRVAAL